MGCESASQRKTSLQCNCCINKKLLKMNRGALQQNEPRTRCAEKTRVCIVATICSDCVYFYLMVFLCADCQNEHKQNVLCRKSTRCPWIQHLNRPLECFSAVCVVSLTLGAAYKACVMVEEVSRLVGFGKSDPGKGHFMSV